LRSIHLLKLQSQASGVAPYLLQLYREWHKKHARAAIMHDPLTIAILLDPKPVQMSEGTLVLSSDGILRHDTRGRKVITCVSVDVERYLEMLIHRIAGGPVPTLATLVNPAEWITRIRGAYTAQHYKNWSL